MPFARAGCRLKQHQKIWSVFGFDGTEQIAVKVKRAQEM